MVTSVRQRRTMLRVRMGARKWAKAVGIPDENIYTLGRSGIENMFSAERAWALPGRFTYRRSTGTRAVAAHGAPSPRLFPMGAGNIS